MEEFKGTKGNWNLEAADENGVFVTAVSLTHSICRIYTRPKDKERQANVQLIVAAPDLLEASIELVESFDGGIENQLYNYEKLLKLKQAIQKALNV